ncbi:MAG: M48 family metallopeptidase [Clostridiales bacterium]|nr:M48 family metallopeptidase [Clostridiales bacterium]
MKRKLIIDDLERDVDIQWKNIKNIILKIKDDGTIVISAPKGVLIQRINLFLEEHIEWIENRISVIERNKKKKWQLENGGTIRILGIDYKVNIFASDENFIKLNMNQFDIYTKKSENLDYSMKIVDKWIRNESAKVFQESFESTIQNMISYKKYKIDIKPRKMSKRWGTCYPQKAVIHLNSKLFHAPKELIDYVVIHEIIHLKVPNHSEKFYSEMEIYCENWKEKRKKLNSEYYGYL